MSDDGVIDDDETHTTEITIQPDGRVYVFGTSRQVLGLLNDLRPNDASLQRRLQQPPEPRRSEAAATITQGGFAGAT
jgi:hypothetical protein